MNIINNPKISIVIPCYNAEKYIQETIDSVLGQSFSDYELIVVNDGSVDGTHEILKKNAERSGKISIVNIENSGESKAFFRGIQNSNCDLIARIDADDLMVKSRLEEQYNYLTKNKELDVLGSWVKKISDEKEYPGVERFSLSPFVTKNFMCLFNQVANPTTLVKRKVYDNFEQNNIKIGTDLNFWLDSICTGYNIGNIPFALTKYRIHENQATANKSNTNASTKTIYENNIPKLMDSNNVDKAFIEFGVLFREGITIKETSSFFQRHIDALKKEELKYGNLDALSDCIFRVYNNSAGSKTDKIRYIVSDFYKHGLTLNVMEKISKFSNKA